MAIEVLPESVPAGFEVLGIQEDPDRQLGSLTSSLQGLCQWRVDSIFIRR
tara:strand:+ start:286 stop:435 length:150 start_codon:yes stop_codon:yes gene_type:complete